MNAWTQPDLFEAGDPAPLSRTSDPSTSHAGVTSIRRRSASQKLRLLEAYLEAHERELGGLTDEEAAGLAGLLERRTLGYWKRCAELRSAGLIEATGQTRPSGETGLERMVCRITDAGLGTLAFRSAGAEVAS